MSADHIQSQSDSYPHWQKWWSGKGNKMAPEPIDWDEQELTIQNGDIATLSISYMPGETDGREPWHVAWHIFHGRADSENDFVVGQFFMTSQELRAAFGLFAESFENDRFVLDRFGGDIACEGKFIRQEPYLNIPCPGTGLEGDPNISVFVSDGIKEAVARLLSLEGGAR